MPKHGSCGSKSPAEQLIHREYKVTGIPKEMGGRSEKGHSKDMDHAIQEREHDRTRVR